MLEKEAGDTGVAELDIEKASADLGAQLFPPQEEPSEEQETTDAPEESGAAASSGPEPKAEAKPGPQAGPQVSPVKSETTPPVKAAPKSWPKEMHAHWEKVPPEVQTYWETREKQMLDGLEQYKSEAGFGKQLKEVLTPYKPILQAAGLDEATAVGTLLNAHYRLTQGSQESKLAAYKELGKNLGLVQSDGTEVPPPDPRYQALEQELLTIKSTLTAAQQAELAKAQQQVKTDVDAFFSDTKAHPYADEVADDMAKLIRAGYSLQDAYATAVMANPVTKAKEIARIQTEHEAKLKENARLEALPKKKASGVNVNSKETRTAPTGPKGSMEDTLRATMQAIKERSH